MIRRRIPDMPIDSAWRVPYLSRPGNSHAMFDACWRERFGHLMRNQGVTANATPRFARGRNKGKTRDATYRAQQRDDSNVVRRLVADVADQLAKTNSFRDPARDRLTASGPSGPLLRSARHNMDRQ